MGTPSDFRNLIEQASVSQKRFRFEPGLNPKSGDTVYMLPSGLATTKDPNAGKVKSLLVSTGIVRRKVRLKIGVISSASEYKETMTCMVILI